MLQFGLSVLQVNSHQMTQFDLRYDVIHSTWCHDVSTSCRKVLPSGECTHSQCLRGAHAAASASSWSISHSYLLLLLSTQWLCH